MYVGSAVDKAPDGAGPWSQEQITLPSDRGVCQCQRRECQSEKYRSDPDELLHSLSMNSHCSRSKCASVHGVRNNSFPLLSKSTMDDGGATSAIPLSVTCEGTAVVLPKIVRACPEGSTNVRAGPSLLTERLTRAFPARSDMTRNTDPALSLTSEARSVPLSSRRMMW